MSVQVKQCEQVSTEVSFKLHAINLTVTTSKLLTIIIAIGAKIESLLDTRHYTQGYVH